MTLNYEKLPEILKWERQWCLAGPDDKGKFRAPHALGPRGLFKVKPTQNFHWKDFETTVEAALAAPPCGIGFVLTKTDSYTCIDLDIKNSHNEADPEKWTSQESIDRFHKIITTFDSYTERSASGQGFHIWVRGKIGEGVRRDGVEVYSQERFIVCTGNVYLDKDIESRQELLDILVSEIKQDSASNKIELIELPQTESDENIFERARSADNSGKFLTLCNGDWNGYPSQSEADLALMSIFTFYSKSNEQCRRMFRMTKLGERAKAVKNDTALDRILSLIRGRQALEDKLDDYATAATNALLDKMRTVTPQNVAVQSTANGVQPHATAPQGITLPPPPAPVANPLKPILFPGEVQGLDDFEEDDNDVDTDKEETENLPGIEWPPGMVGEMAKYIYSGAPRPVKEVAIVSALGLMAGVCGKTFNIPQSGLNLYIVLVAKSAIGKEAMHSGIATIMSFVRESIPKAMDFVDFTDYASGPALSKAVAANHSFVNVSGEWGRKLKRLGLEDGREGPMQQLRTVMTNLYQKSGPASIVGGIGYSDKTRNVESISGAAYSMIGETTPRTFYDSLTENMMEDGFLSRFTVIEYAGARPEANHNGIKKPDSLLLDTLCGLVAHSLDLMGRYATQEVVKSPEAEALLSQFDKECDKQINKTDDESWRQMWNRAHLKAFRIAALLATGDNYITPVIQKQHIEWALMLIRRDIGIMRRRIGSGDVGTGDAPRERKLLSLIKKYLSNPVSASYGVPFKMQEDGIIPRKYLQICTQRSSAFVMHRAGQNAILDATIKSLIDSGYLSEVPKDKAINNYTFHGRCFRILNIPLNSVEEKEIKESRSKW